MADSRIALGETERIIVVALSATSTGVTGATITLTIKRDADGYFWNGTTFQSGATTVTMTETDATNLAGYYHYDFVPKTTDFRVTIKATTATAGVTNAPWSGQLYVGYWADNIDDAITSRASNSDMQQVLKRLGSSIVDNDFRKLMHNTNEILQRVESLETTVKGLDK